MKKLILFLFIYGLTFFCLATFFASPARAANGDVYSLKFQAGVETPFSWPADPPYPTRINQNLVHFNPSATAVAVGSLFTKPIIVDSAGNVYSYDWSGGTTKDPTSPSSYCIISQSPLPSTAGTPIDLASDGWFDWFVLTSKGEIWEIGDSHESNKQGHLVTDGCGKATWAKVSTAPFPSGGQPIALGYDSRNGFIGNLYVLDSTGHLYAGPNFSNYLYDYGLGALPSGSGNPVDLTMTFSYDPVGDCPPLGYICASILEPYVLTDNGSVYRVAYHSVEGKYVWEPVADGSKMPQGHGSPIAIAPDPYYSDSICISQCTKRLRVLDSTGNMYIIPDYKGTSYFRVNSPTFPGNAPVDLATAGFDWITGGTGPCFSGYGGGCLPIGSTTIFGLYILDGGPKPATATLNVKIFNDFNADGKFDPDAGEEFTDFDNNNLITEIRLDSTSIKNSTKNLFDQTGFYKTTVSPSSTHVLGINPYETNGWSVTRYSIKDSNNNVTLYDYSTNNWYCNDFNNGFCNTLPFSVPNGGELTVYLGGSIFCPKVPNPARPDPTANGKKGEGSIDLTDFINVNTYFGATKGEQTPPYSYDSNKGIWDDKDNDGVVDLGEFTAPVPGHLDGRDFDVGGYNNSDRVPDGQVDVSDLLIVMDHFGQVCPASGPAILNVEVFKDVNGDGIYDTTAKDPSNNDALFTTDFDSSVASVTLDGLEITSDLKRNGNGFYSYPVPPAPNTHVLGIKPLGSWSPTNWSKDQYIGYSYTDLGTGYLFAYPPTIEVPTGTTLTVYLGIAQKPDLTITINSINPILINPGTQVTVKFTVSNISANDFNGSFRVDFFKDRLYPWWSTCNDQSTDYKTYTHLKGQLMPPPDSFTFTAGTVGLHHALVAVDTSCQIAEIRKDNNYSNQDYTVVAAIASAWFQTQDSDVGAQGLITDHLPSSDYYSSTYALIANPLGTGATSLNGWAVDNYSLDLSRMGSYDKLWSEFAKSGIPLLCSGSSSCSLTTKDDTRVLYGPAHDPANALPYTPPATDSPYSGTKVVFIDANLTASNPNHLGLLFQQDFITGPGSGVIFIVNGDVSVAPTVKEIDALIFTQGMFHSGANVVHDLNGRLTVKGGVMAVGGFDLPRNLGSDNGTYPAVNFIYDPKYLVLFKDSLGERKITWQEVSP